VHGRHYLLHTNLLYNWEFNFEPKCVWGTIVCCLSMCIMHSYLSVSCERLVPPSCCDALPKYTIGYKALPPPPCRTFLLGKTTLYTQKPLSYTRSSFEQIRNLGHVISPIHKCFCSQKSSNRVKCVSILVYQLCHDDE